MNVISSKSNIQHRPATKTDDPAATQSNQESDFFSDIMSSLFTELSGQAIDEDMLVASDTDTATADDPVEQSFNAILYGINPLPDAVINPANNEEKNQSAATPDMESIAKTTENLPNNLVTKNDDNLKNVQTLNATDLSELLAKMNQDIAADDVFNKMIKPESKDPEKIFSADSDQDGIKSFMTSLPNDINAKTELILGGAEHKQTIINKDEEQNNVYVDSLTRLGNFINSHTAPLANLPDKPNHTVNNAVPFNFTDTTSKLMQAAEVRPQIKVELLPTVSVAGVEQTYNANIKIYPPELGSVLAKLKIGKSGAELMIVAENHRVKEIIESHLPQLRENFHQANINLTAINVDVQPFQANVTDQQQQQQQQQRGSQQLGATNEQLIDNKQPSELDSAPKARIINSIIDTYI